MRILIRTTFLFSGLLAAFTIVALLIGREQPISDELALLRFHDFTDCAPPCWIGITPGVTTLSQARARISATYDSNSYVIRYKTTPPELIAFLLYDRANPAFGLEVLIASNGTSRDRPVAAISLFFINFHDFQIPLGEMVNALGKPTYFRVRNTTPNPFYGAALAYSNDQANGVLVGVTCDSRIQYGRIQYDKPTGWLDFTADPLSPVTASTSTILLKSWRGFADYSRYDIPDESHCVP
jgi:hypothetical protein